ncbi:MAG: CDP-diacylglycerol--serine O-phosphatidyltransferase [Bacteroidota bacterium]
MKKHVPNLLTCINLGIGALGIYVVFTINRDFAIYFVMAASVFDFLDGFVARMLNVKSAFGKELDSLADLTSFGLLPCFFMLEWLEAKSSFFFVAILIGIFSALRLAKFNLDDEQSYQFKGLPTPANAIMLTSLVFLSFELGEQVLLIVCVVSSLLLVSNLKLLAIKFEHFRWNGNQWRYVLMASSIAMIMVFKWTFLPFLIPFYLVISTLSNLKRIQPK